MYPEISPIRFNWKLYTIHIFLRYYVSVDNPTGEPHIFLVKMKADNNFTKVTIRLY